MKSLEKKPDPVDNDDTEEQPVLESLLEFISVFPPLSLFRMRSNRFAVCESEKNVLHLNYNFLFFLCVKILFFFFHLEGKSKCVLEFFILTWDRTSQMFAHCNCTILFFDVLLCSLSKIILLTSFFFFYRQNTPK